jgi:two-component system, NtrC family, C4-dicarboxylate transport response regulator DctD
VDATEGALQLEPRTAEIPVAGLGESKQRTTTMDMERTELARHRAEPEPVLVVDDEHGVRDLMARWLRLSGYAIVTCATAEEAIERVKTDGVAVALVDIHMPGHDGHWLTEQLRRGSPDIAVIMVTGLLDVAAACTSLQHGIIDYLVKPFSRERLREAVQRGFDWRRTASNGTGARSSTPRPRSCART